MNKLLFLSVLGALLLVKVDAYEKDKTLMTIQCFECSYFEFDDKSIGDESCSEDKKPNAKFLTECEAAGGYYPYCIKTVLDADATITRRNVTNDDRHLPGLPGQGSTLKSGIVRSCGYIDSLPVVNDGSCLKTNLQHLQGDDGMRNGYLLDKLPHPNFMDFYFIDDRNQPGYKNYSTIQLNACFCQGDKCNPAGNIQAPVFSVLALFASLVIAASFVR